MHIEKNLRLIFISIIILLAFTANSHIVGLLNHCPPVIIESAELRTNGELYCYHNNMVLDFVIINPESEIVYVCDLRVTPEGGTPLSISYNISENYIVPFGQITGTVTNISPAIELGEIGELECLVSYNTLCDENDEDTGWMGFTYQMGCCSEGDIVYENTSEVIPYTSGWNIETNTNINIPTTASTVFEAEQQVRLLPGTTISSGATFRASIVECTDNSQNFTGGGEDRSAENTSINYTEKESEWRIFPNPFTNSAKMQLYFPNSPDIYLNIFNLSGRLVLKDNIKGISNYEIKLAKEAPGIYLVQIVTNEGEFVKKIEKL